MRKRIVSFVAAIALSLGVFGVTSVQPAEAACSGALCALNIKALGTILGGGVVPGPDQFGHFYTGPGTFTGYANGTVTTLPFSADFYPGAGFTSFNGEMIFLSSTQTTVPIGSLAGVPGVGDIRLIQFSGGGLTGTIATIGGVPGWTGTLQQSA